MKVHYSRVSTQEQNEERQLQNLDGFDYTFVDKCSGNISFFDRPKGSQIKQLIDDQILTLLEIHSIDRLGRNTIDVLRTWNDLTEKGITIVCRNPNLTNFKSDGTQDEVSQMIISILSIMSSFERKMILQRQREGIEIGKIKGVYRGRKIGTKEDTIKFTQKEKSQKIFSYLRKGYTYSEISRITGCSYSTIQKVKMIKESQEVE